MPTVSRQTPTGSRPKPAAANGQRSAWDMGSGLKVMLYGQSGTGKTTWWASCPGRILALICSGGMNPGELRSIDTPENRKRISAKVVSSVDEVKEQLGGADGDDMVVLDHVSGLQDLTLKEILGITELPAQKGWGLATQQQWGQSTAQCKEILRVMLGLDCHVVIIGQERRSSEEGMEVGVPTVGVATTPSLAGWLNPAVDFIFQTFKAPRYRTLKVKVAGQVTERRERDKGVDYCLRIGPHDTYVTKFRTTRARSAELPEFLVDSDWQTVVDLIGGE